MSNPKEENAPACDRPIGDTGERCVLWSGHFGACLSRELGLREAKPRRVYTPPAVEETGSFERLVLACSHVPMGHENCHPASVRS